MNRATETLMPRVGGRRARVLHTQGAGPGAPIVLVHGLGLSADVFRPHMRLLARDASAVIAPDLPGFGRSKGPIRGMGVDAVAEWLLELQVALALPPAVWIGHSVAAQAVVRLAARAPGSAAALVLATPTGDRGALRWLLQLLGLARTAFREPGWLVREVARHYLTTLPVRTMGTWLLARRHDPLEDAPDVACPSLIVLGARDPVVPDAFALHLCQRLPYARLKILRDAAHGAALSHASAFVAEVRDFLSTARATPV